MKTSHIVLLSILAVIAALVFWPNQPSSEFDEIEPGTYYSADDHGRSFKISPGEFVSRGWYVQKTPDGSGKVFYHPDIPQPPKEKYRELKLVVKKDRSMTWVPWVPAEVK